MEQLKSVHEGYKNLSMVVIKSAFDDLKTDKEIKNLITKINDIKKQNENDLTVKERRIKAKFMNWVLIDKNARHFFISDYYKFFADILDAEYTVIYKMYLDIISGIVNVK